MTPPASSKSKLGRNPFDKKPPGAARAGSARAEAAPPKRKKRRPSVGAQVRQAAGTKRKRIPDDLDALWHEVTHYWVPRVKACAYLRIIKLVSKFST